MERENIGNNDEEAFEIYEQGSPLLMQSVMQAEILQAKVRPNRFFDGLIFALPFSVFMWGVIICVFL